MDKDKKRLITCSYLDERVLFRLGYRGAQTKTSTKLQSLVDSGKRRMKGLLLDIALFIVFILR